MIHPSYSELFEVINSETETNDKPILTSRYSLCVATAKRARQIIDKSEPLVQSAKCNKPLSIAVEEIYKGEVKLLSGEEEDTTDFMSDFYTVDEDIEN